MAITSDIVNLIAAARAGTSNIKPLALKLRGQGQVFVAEALERLQDCVLSLSRALTSTVALSLSPPSDLSGDMAVQPGDVLTTAGIFNGSITIRAIADAASGARRIMLDVAYSPPVNLGTFAGVLAYSESPDAILPRGRYPYTATHPAAQTISLGPIETKQAVESWTIYLVSYSQLVDKMLDLATGGTPRRAVSVTATTGLDGGRIAAATLQTAAFASTIRPVLLASTNPTLPDPLYPPGTVLYNTTNYTLYKVNAAGTAWGLMVNAGTDVVANSITAGQIAAGAIRTQELYAGELLVGGGGGKPTRFRVNDSANNMIGFIGDNGAGYIGAYLINLRVGPNINAPVVLADSSGVTIDGASFTLTSNGITTVITNASAGGLPAGLRILKTGSLEEARISMDASNYPELFLFKPSKGGVRFGLSSDYGRGILTDDTGSSGIELLAGSYATGSWQGLIVTGGVHCVREVIVNSMQAISSGCQFVGHGVNHPGYGVIASGFNPYVGGVQYTGYTGDKTVIATLTPTWVRLEPTTPKLQSSTDGVNWYDVSATNGIGFYQGSTGATFTFNGGALTGMA